MESPPLHKACWITVTVSGDPNLVNGEILYVANGGGSIGSSPGFAFDANYIRLARTLNDAIGFIDGMGTATTADDVYVAPDPLNLVRNTSGSAISVKHTLREIEDEPLTGLVEGMAYFVVNRSAASFQLATSVGGLLKNRDTLRNR